MYVNDNKLFAKKKKKKKWKKTGNSNTRRENIQFGHRDGIWHRKMCPTCNEKRPTTPDGRNGTARSRQDQKVRRNGNLQILGHLVSGHHQIRGDERKDKERQPKSYLRQNYPIKWINTWAVLLVRYSGPFLKWTSQRTLANEPKTKKTNDQA